MEYNSVLPGVFQLQQTCLQLFWIPLDVDPKAPKGLQHTANNRLLGEKVPLQRHY